MIQRETHILVAVVRNSMCQTAQRTAHQELGRSEAAVGVAAILEAEVVEADQVLMPRLAQVIAIAANVL